MLSVEYLGESQRHSLLKFNDAQKDIVFCEESTNAGSSNIDAESLVGVLLNAFDSPCKRSVTPIAVNVIAVLLCPNQPTSATRAMRLLS
jgi:hypothetical protein